MDLDIKAFTPDQIDMIQRTWTEASRDYINTGEMILITFFEKYPDHQKVFPEGIVDVPTDDLKGNSKLRFIGAKVLNFLSCIIDTLDKDGMEEVTNMIVNLGKFHVEKNLTDKVAFSNIREVIMEIMTDACSLGEEEIDAWNNLFDIFFCIMFAVFDGKV